MRFLFFLPVLALIFAVPAHAHAPERHGFQLVTFKRPPPAIAFELPSLKDKPVTLADFRGKLLLLNFWATWCLPCVREMPSMEALYQKYKGRDFEVLAISLDAKGAALVRPFVKRLKLTFPIGLDEKSEISGRYGARSLPSSFLIDPDGRVIAAAKGERDWFSPEAQTYLEELLAGYSKKVVRK